MILGMSLSTFVTVHVIISLIGIVAGIIVMFGLLGSNRMPGLTAIFLLFTILTSATGFLIPPLLTDRALRHGAFRRLALDLCGDRDDLALPQRIRTDHPELPEGTGAACAGAERAAKRAAIRHRSRYRACVLRHCDHRRRAKISADADIRLNGVRSSALSFRHSGATRSVEPGISRFRVHAKTRVHRCAIAHRGMTTHQEESCHGDDQDQRRH
jgi:hypothetical protein